MLCVGRGRGDERVATTCRRWGQIVRGGWNIAAGRGPPAPSLSRTPTAPRLSIGSDSVTVNVPFPPTKNVALAPGCPPSVVCMPPMHPRRRSAAGASIIRRRCLTDATRAPNRSPRHLSTGSPCLRDRAGLLESRRGHTRQTATGSVAAIGYARVPIFFTSNSVRRDEILTCERA